MRRVHDQLAQQQCQEFDDSHVSQSFLPLFMRLQIQMKRVLLQRKLFQALYLKCYGDCAMLLPPLAMGHL